MILSAPFSGEFILIAIIAPILWGYFCGRLKRHNIGLPLAFILYVGLLVFYTTVMFSWIGLVALAFPVYFISALVGYHIGFQQEPLSTKDKSS